MKSGALLGTWRATTFENRISRVVILVLALAVVLLAWLAGRVERTVVLVPPILEGEVTLSASGASPEVEQAWALYVAELIGNVTPRNVDLLVRTIEPLLAGPLRDRILEAIAAQADDIKREGVSMRFEPRDVLYDPASRTVYVNGRHQSEGPGSSKAGNERTYELRMEFRHYRPRITHLDVYPGPPKLAEDTPR